jgi:hypothetical protein
MVVQKTAEFPKKKGLYITIENNIRNLFFSVYDDLLISNHGKACRSKNEHYPIRIKSHPGASLQAN